MEGNEKIIKIVRIVFKMLIILLCFSVPAFPKPSRAIAASRTRRVVAMDRQVIRVTGRNASQIQSDKRWANFAVRKSSIGN